MELIRCFVYSTLQWGLVILIPLLPNAKILHCSQIQAAPNVISADLKDTKPEMDCVGQPGMKK